MHIELSPDKRYYSIGEVAKAFNVNSSLIRFWDKEFDILINYADHSNASLELEGLT